MGTTFIEDELLKRSSSGILTPMRDGDVMQEHCAPTFIVAASDSLHPGRADYVCDGTDDQVTIQAAIDAANTIGGGKVILMEGNYYISATIDLHSNIVFSGVGSATYIHLSNAAECDMIRVDGTSSAKENVIVEHLKLDGNKGNQVGVGNLMGIYFKGRVTDSSVIGCIVHDVEDLSITAYNSGGVDGEGAERILFTQNTCFDSGRDGIALDDYANNFIISNNICYNNHDYGIGTARGCYNFTIDNNVLDGNLIGILLFSQSNSVIANNIIRNSTDWGMQIAKNAGYSESTNLVISNNYIRGAGVQLDSSQKCMVADNIIDGDGTTIGIYAKIGGNLTIKDNQIHNTGALWGLKIASDKTVVDGNVFYGDKGITEATGYGSVIYRGNDFRALTSTKMSLIAYNDIRDNPGFVTENSGTATLVNGQTSIAVAHGLAVTPSAGDIVVIPIEAWGNMTTYYIDTYTATHFTIRSPINPGQDVDFAWKAIVL